MAKKSKFFMIFATFALAIAMAGCGVKQEEKIEAQPLYSNEWVELGEFDFDGLNATPMKEVTVEGFSFVEVKAEYSAKDEIYFLAEIYYEDPDYRWPIARMNPLAKEGEVTVKAPISPSRRFQILTQAFQPDGSYDGNYVVDRVKLSYRLTTN